MIGRRSNLLARMLTLAGISFALPAPAAAQQVQVTLDRAKTHIDWTLGDVLHAVQGTFQLKSGAIWKPLATPTSFLQPNISADSSLARNP